MTVPGVDTAGDGGLLGLALSPTYAEDGLVYAYLSTATDNRVVRLPARRHAEPGADRHPARERPTTAAGCCSAPTARCSSAPATPATRRWPATPTRWPARCCGSTSSVTPAGATPGLQPRPPRRDRAVPGASRRRGDPLRHRRRRPPARTSSTRSSTAATTAAPAARRPVTEVRAAEGGLGGCAVAGHRRCSSARWTASGCDVADARRRRAAVTGDPRTSSTDRTAGCAPSSSTPTAPCGSPRPTATASARPTADDDRVLRILPAEHGRHLAAVTPRSSGSHRGQEPFPGCAEPSVVPARDPSGPTRHDHCRQALLEHALDGRGVGLAAGGLHDRADQRADRLHLAAAHLLGDVGVARDRRVDGRDQLVGLPHDGQAARLDDLRRGRPRRRGRRRGPGGPAGR